MDKSLMKSGPLLQSYRLLLFILLISMKPLILSGETITVNSYLRGHITNSLSGAAIIGAKVELAGHTTFSVIDGSYLLPADTSGTFSVIFLKHGFDQVTMTSIILVPGDTTTLDVALQESLNPPGPVIAVLDTQQTFVHVSWQLPTGPYILIYDDGIQDDFTVWANQGNMNAVRFTPPAYPAVLTGAMINIGVSANYPPGSIPLVPFQVRIYDATGPGDSPGNQIAGPFDVLPGNLGWVEFQLTSAVTISSGSFFIAMVQGGNSPNASGLAIDLTIPQFRSFSRYVTGDMPWMPAQGNFMIRAILEGPGGPVDLAEMPDPVTGYQVWRLRQGEELNPAVWTSIGITSDNLLDDDAWVALSCGPWRWGVKAGYSGNRWSPVTFSNVIGKCWTIPVTLDVQLTCPASTTNGAWVQMKNLVYPDTLYGTIADSSGQVTFPTVWKGSYEIQVRKFGYLDFTQNYSADYPDTIQLMVLQKKSPPSFLSVDEKSLFSVWDVPFYRQLVFSEEWSSGSLFTQGWTIEGGFNWRISNSTGNPKPSAMFDWNPPRSDYSQSIISKPIFGEYSPILTLTYDIYLDNFSTSALNQMAVEINYDSTWYTLKTWDNAGGSIPWYSDEIDISTYSDKPVRIRFRAFGEDSYQINGWYVDNISVVASESAHLLAPCILGYNFYLNDVMVASVTENNYTIPGELLKYDSGYNACVVAIYTSGYSPSVCDSVNSRFLWPPSNLSGIPAGNSIFLEWEKPLMPTDTGFIVPSGLKGYTVYRDDSLLVYLPYPDSLSLYDTGLEPGAYTYMITAMYDLAPYGYPGEEDQSAPEGPVLVELSYGQPIPFTEPWDQASFGFNEWRFNPGQGNWIMDTDNGNPPPSAKFSGTPSLAGYSVSLESTVLNASSLNCASVWLDFDLKLEDMDGGETEELSAGTFSGGNWHKKSTWKNNGSFDWLPVRIDISTVRGKGFRIGFTCSGQNSENLVGWSIDNIHVYAICLPPVNLTGENSGDNVQLRWSPPECNGGGFILNEGFEEEDFPPSRWTQVIHNPAATWSHTDYTSPVGVHSGNYSAGLSWDYNLQDEWLIVHDVYVGGNLQFWSMAYQGSTHGDHYYVKVSTDNEVTWETLFDLSQLAPYPGGYNQWEEPYTVDLSPYLGEVVHIAWHAWDGNGQGCWYYWGVDDCSVGGKRLELFADAQSYDIYCQDPDATGFILINPQAVMDTSYLDTVSKSGLYKYYLIAVNETCSGSIPSDTIEVDVITSVQDHRTGSISIFPNPASDYLIIRADVKITGIHLINTAGLTVFAISNNEEPEIRISVTDLSSGLYVLKLLTESKVIARRVSVIHQ